jgi:drug/metabolite transporter (DMT)-like permease
MRRSFAPIWQSAWALLALGNLFWAGNIVLGRGIAGQIPPVTLAWTRWTGAFLIAIGFAWPHLKRDAPVLLRHWPVMLLLGATGIACYNTMSYVGLTETTALNVLLLQSALPLIIIVWAFLIFGERPSIRQTAGVVLSLLGVAAIAAHGSIDALISLRLNHGDLWIVLAMAIYGIYTVMLRRRPKVHPLSFLVTAMAIGSCLILPFSLLELVHGARFAGRLTSWLAIGYIVVFPSFIAYLFFNRGVELAGATLAGQSMHLMPLFGSILAVLFLGETLHLYHAAGAALIAAGILLASSGAATARRPAPPQGSLHPKRT